MPIYKFKRRTKWTFVIETNYIGGGKFCNMNTEAARQRIGILIHILKKSHLKRFTS